MLTSGYGWVNQNREAEGYLWGAYEGLGSGYKDVSLMETHFRSGHFSISNGFSKDDISNGFSKEGRLAAPC